MAGRPKKLLEDIEADGWDLLDALVVWASSEYCAEKLGVSNDTLMRRINERFGCDFAEYKNKRREPMFVNLLKKQYDVAMSGNVSMLIWLGKNYLSQSENGQVGADEDDRKTFHIKPYVG